MNGKLDTISAVKDIQHKIAIDPSNLEKYLRELSNTSYTIGWGDGVDCEREKHKESYICQKKI